MHADIFCRRIDNYGDIGVCWRLAQHLQQAHWRVRLWVDDLFTFSQLEPRCHPNLAHQRVAHIDIVAWTPSPPAYRPADVVIEGFGCELPATFRAAMQRQPPIWINLEYLSGQAWVDTHHGLPSPQADGLTKYFFFPGFTRATGGLLREPGLIQRRNAFQQSRDAQQNFLKRCTQPSASTLDTTNLRIISLFCYPEAPLKAFVSALTQTPQPTLLLVPEGIAPQLRPEDASPPLHIVRIPFLSQDDYDHLLWCADLNIVRGEDSLVRAGWAARPLIWQPYLQTENTHLEKLDAWLAHYAPPRPAQQLIHRWNHPDTTFPLTATWQAATQGPSWTAWQAAAQQWAHTQAAYPDLATHLIAFCAKQHEK